MYVTNFDIALTAARKIVKENHLPEAYTFSVAKTIYEVYHGPMSAYTLTILSEHYDTLKA